MLCTHEPVVDCRSLHDPFAELRKLERGHAVPAVVRESVDLTAVLVREEPVEEAGVVLHLRPDDGTPDIEHGAVEHFAEAFRLAVDVERIVWIALDVLSSGARVYAAGGDLDDASPCSTGRSAE